MSAHRNLKRERERKQLKLYHGKATGPVNRCYMQTKNSMPELRSEPRIANPLCIGHRR